MKKAFYILLPLVVIMGLNLSEVKGQTVPNDTMTIFYRSIFPPDDPRTPEQSCAADGSMSLGEFVKRVAVGEIGEAQQQGWDTDSIKAVVIAIRTFTISPYKSFKYSSGGNDYHCTNAWEQQGFFLSDFETRPLAELATEYPTIFQMVDATEGIIMTHPDAVASEVFLGWPTHMRFGAIEAAYKRETGWFTAESNRAWLKEIFDPISSGSPQTGMGQLGAKRWAQGADDASKEYPKWDYRRILVHYYSEVEFVGVSPTPPNDFRSNIVEIQGLDLPNGGLVICKGEVRTGYNVRYQNVGNTIPTDDAFLPGLCSGVTNPQTGVGYHIYNGNSLACPNCEGLRVGKLCYPGASIPSGKDILSFGFEIFVPDVSQLVEGNTYSLRFDTRRNGVWQGRSNGFPWPPQDIPITICESGGGSGGGPQIVIDHPPAVVSHASLSNGRYGLSWSSHNATSYDVEYRSKEIYQASYPTNFNTLLSNSTAQQFSAPVGCNEDRLDWQFRVRGRNSNGTGDWGYAQSQTRVYPHPWPSYWNIGALVVLDSDPGPWSRPNNILNLGGGSFNWTATDDQSWITTNSSGQGEGPLGTVISKPGGVGDYFGIVTVNLSNFQPNVNCSGTNTFQLPVGVYVRTSLETYYLPIIFKNSP